MRTSLAPAIGADAARDQQAAEAEKKALAGLLGQHGGEAFHEEFWDDADNR